ncbi:hypothetical protein MNEG_9464, partial [Monoraphidium neglectum]
TVGWTRSELHPWAAAVQRRSAPTWARARARARAARRLAGSWPAGAKRHRAAARRGPARPRCAARRCWERPPLRRCFC